MTTATLPTFKSILTSAEGIAISTMLPVIVAFLSKVQANSSIENLVAQGPALVAALQAALPGLGQAEAAFIAGQLQIILTTAAASAPQPPAAS